MLNSKVNPLIKYNKLKRFSFFVHNRLRHKVNDEILKIDMLGNDIYTKSDMYEKLDSIAKCASLVELRKYENGETKIHNANFCHNPAVCPICADRISKRRKAIYSTPIRKAVKKFAIDKYSSKWKKDFPNQYTGVYLATATIKDGDNLKERIDVLIESIKRMRKLGQKRIVGYSFGEWRKVRAGISNVEIKKGKKSGAWHVHIHFLIFTSEPIDYNYRNSSYKVDFVKGDNAIQKMQVSKFNYEWFIATKGEGVNFDLKPIQYKRYIHGKKCIDFSESVEAQAQEVLKYNTQLSEKKGINILSAANYIELIERRGTRRLFNTIGLLRCDKRNPESLITLTQREAERLEYVDKVDNQSYEIYSALWQRGGTYQEPHKEESAIFADSDDKLTNYVNVRKRAFQVQTAKYQGEYRKERNQLLKNRFIHSDKIEFENILDDLKNAFRNKVKSLWEKFNDNDYLPDFLCDFDSTGFLPFKDNCLKNLLPF